MNRSTVRWFLASLFVMTLGVAGCAAEEEATDCPVGTTAWKFDSPSGSGEYRMVCMRANGGKHGPVTAYWANGTTKYEGYYRNGKKHGTWTIRDESGKVIGVEEYRDGALVTAGAGSK